MTDPTGSEAWARGVARARLLLAQADPEVVDLDETDSPPGGPDREVDLGPYDASGVDFSTTPPVVAARQILARIRAERALDHPDSDVRQEADR